MVTCRPEILIRCATPVVRKMSHSARSIAAWSPTTSAASTPARAGCCTRNSIASRRRWRKRCTGDPASACSSSARVAAVWRTVPLARMPCSKSHSSRSNPCGFKLPCGWRRRAVNRQRWPACTVTGGPPSSASSSTLRYQPSVTRAGTSPPKRSGTPACCADSSSNTKCVPVMLWRGSDTTCPVSTRSWPSSAGCKASFKRHCARVAVSTKPNASTAPISSSHTGKRRRQRHDPATPSAATSASTNKCQAGHKSDCCNCSAVPAKPASAVPAQASAGATTGQRVFVMTRQCRMPTQRLKPSVECTQSTPNARKKSHQRMPP